MLVTATCKTSLGGHFIVAPLVYLVLTTFSATSSRIDI